MLSGVPNTQMASKAISSPSTSSVPTGIATAISQFGSANGDVGPLILSDGVFYWTAYISSSKTDEILSVPLAGGSPTILASFGPNITAAAAFASGDKLYGTMTSSEDGTIFSLPTTGGNPTTIADVSAALGQFPQGLMLSGNTIYGLAVGTGEEDPSASIFSAPVKGGTPKVLLAFAANSGILPDDFAVSGSTIYVSEGFVMGAGGRLVSLPITGGTPTLLASLSPSLVPEGIVLVGNTLYFSTSFNGDSEGSVFSIPISGGAPQIVAQDTIDPNLSADAPEDLTLSNGTIYGITALGGSYLAAIPTDGAPASLVTSLNVNGESGTLAYAIYGDACYVLGFSGTLDTVGTLYRVQLPPNSSVSLSSTHVPVYEGQRVTFTAAVAAAPGTSSAPTGTVTFYDGGDAIGTVPLANGTASFNDATLPIGSNSITATYSGDANYASATTTSALIANVRPVLHGTTPTITSPPTTTSTPGTFIPLHIAATDTAGTAGSPGLRYTWTAIHLPAGAKMPSFNRNGTNAAQNIIARFTKAGGYVLRCEVKNAAGNAATTDIAVNVLQTATTLKLSPAHPIVSVGKSVTLSATEYDQFGHPLANQPSPTFTLAQGSDTLNHTTGLFTAQSFGSALIQIEDGDLTGSLALQVIP
jgi:hypothetical protein